MNFASSGLQPETLKDWHVINLPILNKRNVPLRLRAGLDQAANFVKQDLYKKLSNIKRRTGRRYVIDGKVHIASSVAGNEYPAELKGHLRNSINIKVEGVDEFQVFSNSNEEYVNKLENSQRHYLKRNIEENRDIIRKRIHDAIIRGMKDGIF